jgi:hypothetical protein
VAEDEVVGENSDGDMADSESFGHELDFMADICKNLNEIDVFLL